MQGNIVIIGLIERYWNYLNENNITGDERAKLYNGAYRGVRLILEQNKPEDVDEYLNELMGISNRSE